MKRSRYGLLIVSIILIAVCLRGPITGVGPLLSTLQALLGLSDAAAGMLTTLPLLTFALVSFLTAPLCRKIGMERLIFISILALFIGLIVRSFVPGIGLFVGTVILSIGIGVNNVMLPVIIKARFSKQMGMITGLYTTLMAAFASISSGVTVPLNNIFSDIFSVEAGWKFALCIWIILVVLAFVFWLPNLKTQSAAPFENEDKIKTADSAADSAVKISSKKKSVARSPITWYITLFMGIQSMIFYFTVSWFASILQSYGFSPETAGLLNMLMMLCGLPGSFVMPIIASRTKHQSLWGAIIGFLYVAGMFSLIFAYHPAGLVITILTNGFGSGSAIAFIMVLIGLHTKDAQDASSLSAFSQGVGYIFAAAAPVFMGALHDACGSWVIPLIVMTVIAVICTVCGWLSGLNKMVETD